MYVTGLGCGESNFLKKKLLESLFKNILHFCFQVPLDQMVRLDQPVLLDHRASLGTLVTQDLLATLEQQDSLDQKVKLEALEQQVLLGPLEPLELLVIKDALEEQVSLSWLDHLEVIPVTGLALAQQFTLTSSGIIIYVNLNLHLFYFLDLMAENNRTIINADECLFHV